MDKNTLLAELEDIIRVRPTGMAIYEMNDDAVLNWYGCALAILKKWDSSEALKFEFAMQQIHSGGAIKADEGVSKIKMVLFQAAHDLRMDTAGPRSVAIEGGAVFDYYNGLSKIIELADKDIFFIDPYLDSNFVEKFLPHVKEGTQIRLLGRNKKNMATLIAAAESFSEQYGHTIQVRIEDTFHDRHIIVDGTECYQSGASFKDGARNSATTITQNLDTALGVITIYEEIWARAEEKYISASAKKTKSA